VAIGASSSGSARRRPSSVHDGSTSDTSTITRGRIQTRRQAAALSASVCSSPAPPAK
jgi:hypothetical protein